MPLDPETAALLRMIEELGLPDIAESSVTDARGQLRLLSFDHRDPSTVPEVASVTEGTVAESIPVRVYRPAADGPLATVVFLHGGGWVIGDLDTHDAQCRRLCNDLPAVVVSVDYRLAPEHPFPAAVEDSYAALRWVAEHIEQFGGDAGRLVVGGDSAGGNLAAVCAQQAHADGLTLAAQLLVYPSVDIGGDYPSVEENAEGYFLTKADMEWFRRHYVGVADTSDPRLTPLRADSLAGLAPAVVVTAHYDPLRDEGNAYAEALRSAGVRTEHREFPGLIHGFYGFGAASAAAAEAIAWTNGALARVLEETARPAATAD